METRPDSSEKTSRPRYARHLPQEVGIRMVYNVRYSPTPSQTDSYNRTSMNFSTFVRRLSHPRVRRRLKIGLSLWAVAITVSLVFKLAYDIGYFKAQSLIDKKNAAAPANRPVLTLELAQNIVSGALKEDFGNPKTIVSQIIDNDQKVSTIIIENNGQKRIGWIIDLRLFFTGDLFNNNGYNLTEALEQQYNIRSANH